MFTPRPAPGGVFPAGLLLPTSAVCVSLLFQDLVDDGRLSAGNGIKGERGGVPGGNIGRQLFIHGKLSL